MIPNNLIDAYTGELKQIKKEHQNASRLYRTGLVGIAILAGALAYTRIQHNSNTSTYTSEIQTIETQISELQKMEIIIGRPHITHKDNHEYTITADTTRLQR